MSSAVRGLAWGSLVPQGPSEQPARGTKAENLSLYEPSDDKDRLPPPAIKGTFSCDTELSTEHAQTGHWTIRLPYDSCTGLYRCAWRKSRSVLTVENSRGATRRK